MFFLVSFYSMYFFRVRPLAVQSSMDRFLRFGAIGWLMLANIVWIISAWYLNALTVMEIVSGAAIGVFSAAATFAFMVQVLVRYWPDPDYLKWTRKMCCFGRSTAVYYQTIDRDDHPIRWLHDDDGYGQTNTLNQINALK